MNLLENSKLVFVFFILLGFIAPWWAEDLRFLLIPSLIVMMTLSVKDVHLGHLNKDNYKRVFKDIMLNYFVLSPIIIFLALVFVDNPAHLKGFIVLASVPPAASIIPLALIFRGDIKDTVMAEIVSYLFALVFSPMLIYFFFRDSVDVWYYVRILFLIIVLPLLFSRIIHKMKHRIFEKKNILVNLVYGFSFYIFIGLNHKTFTQDPASLLSVAIVVFLLTFVLGTIIFLTLKLKRVKLKEDIMFVLFGTFKNGNAAATIAIVLFGPAAAIPVAVRGLLTPFYFAFLEKMFHWHQLGILNKISHPRS